MKIEQIYTGCLAEAAYYIESNGEAAIIDPLREIDPTSKRPKTIIVGSDTFLRPIFTPTLCPATWTWPTKPGP